MEQTLFAHSYDYAATAGRPDAASDYAAWIVAGVDDGDLEPAILDHSREFPRWLEATGQR